MSVDQATREKIQKTLRLAFDRNGTPEGDTAWKKASSMMKKYNITVDEVYGFKQPPKSVVKSLPYRKERVKFWTTIRSIKPIKIQKDEQITFQIIPDPSVMCGRNIDSVLNVFHSMKEDFMERVWNKGFQIVYKQKDFASYRIVYEHERITFYVTIPKRYERVVWNSLNSAFPKSAIDKVDLQLKLNPNKTQCAYVELRDHFFKATLVDRNRQAPMDSLMASGRNVLEGDLAVLDMAFLPMGRNWQTQARKAFEKARAGIEPRKRPQSLLDFFFVFGDTVNAIFEGALGIFDTMLGYDGDKTPVRRDEMKQFEQPTNQKSTKNGFDVVIRIASQSEDANRADLTLRSIGTSFKDLSLDNEFDIRMVNKNKSFINKLSKNDPPLLRINGNIMSVDECTHLFQLPQIGLQTEFPEIERIETLETQADKTLLDDSGMLLGEVNYKRKTVPVYMPTKNWDDFCRTMIVMGGQGQGKTKGFLANLLIGAYLNGYSALAIDCAKKEISEQIEFAVKRGVVKKEDFIHYDAGKMAFSLDWKEALYDEEDGMSRLASTCIDFFKIENDTTGQTGRFLRALIMCMSTGKMLELVDLMEDAEKLEEASRKLKGIPLKTIQSFLKMGDTQRRQVVAPIYNRLDQIMSDNYLSRCLESENEIDMVEILCQRKKIFVFDFSDEDLLAPQQDICINLLFSKIDLAMRLRKKIKGADQEFPFFIACDEPAKYLKSADIWEAMTVQGRKWRIGFCWAFHYFTQLPKGFQEAIKNSLPHYFFYPTSKDQWQKFSEEISPFTIEHAMKIKAFHAINYIYSNNGYFTPFVAKMTAPPTMRFYQKKKANA